MKRDTALEMPEHGQIKANNCPFLK